MRHDNQVIYLSDEKGNHGAVYATFDYHSDPGRHTLSNGDPGYPPELTVSLINMEIVKSESDPDFDPSEEHVESYIYQNFEPDKHERPDDDDFEDYYYGDRYNE
jgi:hypothetical protein